MASDADVSKAVGTTAGIGAAVATAAIAGSAAEAIPLLGTVIHAAAIALAAFAAWMSSLFHDSFNMPATAAAAWLVVFRMDPLRIFQGLDDITEPGDGAQLVRWLRVRSGEVPTGAKGNTGTLEPPRTGGIWGNLDCSKNPYLCTVDPAEPLTDPAVLTQIRACILKWHNQDTGLGADKNTALDDFAHAHEGEHTRLDDYAAQCQPPHRHPDDAKALLRLIRRYPAPFKTIVQDPKFTDADQLQAAVRATRIRAGENGPARDLEKIFGGTLTVKQPSHAQVVAYKKGRHVPPNAAHNAPAAPHPATPAPLPAPSPAPAPAPGSAATASSVVPGRGWLLAGLAGGLGLTALVVALRKTRAARVVLAKRT